MTERSVSKYSCKNDEDAATENECQAEEVDPWKAERANDGKWKQNDYDVRGDVVDSVDTPQYERRQARACRRPVVDLMDWAALKDRDGCEDSHEYKDDGEDDEADLPEEARGKDAEVQEDNRRFGQVDGELVIDLKLEEVL